MGRRIETGPKTPMLDGTAEPQEDYLGRLVKYVPTEIIGLYLAASGPVPKSDGGQPVILWLIFAACIILTPVYLWFATNDKEKGPLVLQIVLATIAFPVWVFAVGGPFMSLPWYQGYIASILLVFVTFIFGLIKPKPGS
jgi:hypothetical protein